MSELMNTTQAMRRALTLAARGPARNKNPQVGCVILATDGHVLSEGWHRGSGTPHAEIDALSKIAPGSARGATAVVTLEPCHHQNHKGRCATALLEAGITHLVYGVDDPVPAFSGGAALLHNAGVSITRGVLASEIEALLGSWMCAAKLGRPVVTLKWASSLDGCTAAANGTSQWITGTEARRDVHTRRARFDAIITGTGTVIADDPALTARNPDGSLMMSQPVPVVVGSRDIPPHAKVRSHPHEPVMHAGNDLRALLDSLRDRGMQRVLVEAGPRLSTAFVRENVVDTFLIYMAPALLGGPHHALSDIGVSSIDLAHRLSLTSVERAGDDLIITAIPQGGNAHVRRNR